jgi:hypothetical protein
MHHAEGLKFRAGLELGVVTVEHDFAEILGAAFRGDRPQHVSQEFLTVNLRRAEFVKARLDFCGARSALHASLPLGHVHQRRSRERHGRGALTMMVVDRFDRS